MSSNQYTIWVEVKTGPHLKQVMEAISGQGRAGGGSGGGRTGGGGLFKTLESIGALQLLKLVGISTSLGGIALMMIKSSGYLQGTLKILETSVTLFLKPIADFIGLALRPLAIGLLLLAIPFYREAGKWFRLYGNTVGKSLSDLPTTIGNMLTGGLYGLVKELIEGFGPKISFSFTAGSSGLQKAWDDFVKNLSVGLASVPTIVTKVFTDFSVMLWNWITVIPFNITKLFTDFGMQLWNEIVSVPGMIYDVFKGLADNLISTLAGIPRLIYDAIMSWVRSLTGGGGGGGSTSGSTGQTQTRTMIMSIADTLA